MSDCRFGVSPVNYPDPDPGRFARFHVRPESFRSTVATPPHVISPNNRFYKMFLSAITFVIDVDISLYSSLHSVENV